MIFIWLEYVMVRETSISVVNSLFYMFTVGNSSLQWKRPSDSKLSHEKRNWWRSQQNLRGKSQRYSIHYLLLSAFAFADCIKELI